jgi:hypothetical protein
MARYQRLLILGQRQEHLTQDGSVNMPAFCRITSLVLPRSSLFSVIAQCVSRLADVPSVVLSTRESQ